MAGQTDHIQIHLIDGQVGTDATDNYYMRFHVPVPKDEWIQTNHLVHPLLTGGSTDPINDPGEWNIAGPYNNRTAGIDSVTYTESSNITDSVTGSMGTDLPGGEEAEAFLATMGITLGTRARPINLLQCSAGIIFIGNAG